MLTVFVKYPMDLFPMCHFVVRGVDQDIVHVDGEPILSEFLGEYHIHYCLECGGRVRESEEHDSWFKQPLISDEGCLPLVPFFDVDVVVPPSNVELREQ